MRLYFGQPDVSDDELATVGLELSGLVVVLANTTASEADVTLHLVATDGSPTDTNTVVPGVTLEANSVSVLELPISLAVGERLVGSQGTSGAVTVLLDGEPKT